MKRADFNTNTKNNDEWLTPPHIIKALGPFDLDPCAPDENRRPWSTAALHYSKGQEESGLIKKWIGKVWCNPPYGRETFNWLSKLAEHGNGIALIFARTETIGFHAEIWNKADAIFFFKGRLRFHKIDGSRGDTANAPSCLVAYGENNIKILDNSGLKGKLIILK